MQTANILIDPNVLEVMKEVGRRWKSLTPKQKEEFENKAKEDKKRFDMEMEQFNREINKVNITITDEKSKVKTPTKKGKAKKGKAKAKTRKRSKRSSESYADYYYPGKTYDTKHAEVEKPKCDYSLRRRNRTVNKEYVEPDSDDFDDEVSEKEQTSEQKGDKDLEEKKHAGAMPKKPLSSYIFFSQQVREQIKKEMPNISVNELIKEISNRWALANAKDKAPYNDMAKDDKVRYEHELNVYKQSLKSPQLEEGSEADNQPRKRAKNEFSQRPALQPADAEFMYKRDMGMGQAPRRQPSNNVAINIVPENPNNSNPIRTKKERRSKKHFDYQYRAVPEADEYLNPPTTDFMEGRSSMSNNRMVINEDKNTERSRPDSLQFPFNEDDDKEYLLNKDSPPDNEYISPFGRNQQEVDQSYGDELGKMAAREVTNRSENNRFPSVENNVFSGNNGNETQPTRHYFSNYRNYDGMQNDSFYQGNSSFKNDIMDFNDSSFNRNYVQPFGNNYGGMDFKFSSMNPMANPGRPHQNSFSNPFGDMSRGPSFGPDYPNNVMNPNSVQYSGSMNNPMNYYPYPQRRNTFGHKR